MVSKICHLQYYVKTIFTSWLKKKHVKFKTFHKAAVLYTWATAGGRQLRSIWLGDREQCTRLVRGCNPEVSSRIFLVTFVRWWYHALGHGKLGTKVLAVETPWGVSMGLEWRTEYVIILMLEKYLCRQRLAIKEELHRPGEIQQFSVLQSTPHSPVFLAPLGFYPYLVSASSVATPCPPLFLHPSLPRTIVPSGYFPLFNNVSINPKAVMMETCMAF